MLNWTLTVCQAGDCPQAAYLLGPHLTPACAVVADSAYDSDGLRGWVGPQGALAVIPPDPRRKRLPHFDPLTYAKRNHIAQTFNKLKQHHRLATRYDKLDTSFEAFICARILTLYLN